ncbi:MAG: hypothetical protein RL215_3282 [Planctomycetota bacterium]
MTSFGFSGQSSPVRELLRVWLEQPRLLLAVDVLIAFLLLGFPFVMGGRESWGHWLLISCACLLSGLWCLHRFREGGRLRLLWLEPLAIAGLVLVWFQVQPLPAGVLGQFSAEYRQLIPAWGDLSSGAVGGGSWGTISFLPVETQHALQMLAGYVLIAVVLAQRLSTREDCERILKLTAVSGVLMAVFAVLQLVFSNDRFFWFYQHPWTGTREVLKGAFTNRNHFAQFLSLSLGPLIWWALAGRPEEQASPAMNRRGLGPAQGNHSRMDTIVNPLLLLLLAGTAGVLLAVLLSLSRGGFVAAGTACCVMFAGLWRSGRVGSSLAFSMILVGGLAVAGIAAFGSQKVESRVNQLATLDADRIDESSARRAIWRADLNAWQKYPLLGTGVGSHRYVYPAYMEDYGDHSTFTFSHAESSWIHLVLETGLAGVALLAAGLALIGFRLLRGFLQRRDASRTAALAAAAAGLAGGLVHSAADFIWYVPAIVVTTLALAVAALRLSAGDEGESGLPVPRVAWLGMAAACLLMLIVVQPELQRRIAGERWWNRYLVALNEARRAAAASDVEAEDGGGEPTLIGDADEGAERGSTEAVEGFAEEAVTAAGEAAANYGDGNQQQQATERMAELRAQLAMLLRAWKERPTQPDVAVHLARRSLELFELQQQQSENPLPLVQIRDAVLSSNFESVEAMRAFLDRAFGKGIRLVVLADTMSREALQLCPLQTEAWRNLIGTGFLRDPQDGNHLRTIAQTLRLGRYDPATRFSVGQSLFLAGRTDEAVAQWNAAFHANRDIRRRICRALAPRFPVQTLLTNFNPRLEELEDVFEAYAGLQNAADLERLIGVVLEHTKDVAAADFSKQLKSSDQRNGGEDGGFAELEELEESVDSGSDEKLRRLPHFLMQTAAAAAALRLTEKQELLLRRAATLAPESEAPRRALGLLLMEQENYREAEFLFSECQDLNPGDTRLDDLRSECRRLQQAKNRRLRSVSDQRGDLK